MEKTLQENVNHRQAKLMNRLYFYLKRKFDKKVEREKRALYLSKQDANAGAWLSCSLVDKANRIKDSEWHTTFTFRFYQPVHQFFRNNRHASLMCDCKPPRGNDGPPHAWMHVVFMLWTVKKVGRYKAVITGSTTLLKKWATQLAFLLHQNLDSISCWFPKMEKD